MISRRAADAGTRTKIERHSFCPIGVTELLRKDSELEVTTYSHSIFVRKNVSSIHPAAAAFQSLIAANVIAPAVSTVFRNPSLSKAGIGKALFDRMRLPFWFYQN